MRNKPVLATLSLLFLAFSIYAGVLFLDSRSTDTRSLAAATPTMNLETDEVSYPVHVNFAVTVKLDTLVNPVDTVKAIITFDPTILTALSITPLQAYSSQLVETQDIDNRTGKITLTLSPAVGTPPDNIAGSIGIIVFQAKQAGSTTLTLSEESSASIRPSNTNIIENLLSLPLTITP